MSPYGFVKATHAKNVAPHTLNVNNEAHIAGSVGSTDPAADVPPSAISLSSVWGSVELSRSHGKHHH